MRPFLAALALGAVANLSARGGDLRYFDDAALHAVQFVDENEGWAAGDEGVMWHTVDGGTNWERQPTGVRASLRSLHFLTPYTGWAAGREELPHRQGSAGVLLFTRDGGLKWQRAATNAMPGLSCVRFVDHKNGFAVGDSSDQFPTGIFRTNDSGRTWQPVSGPRFPAWLSADFQDERTGALAGAWSSLGLLRQGSLVKADVDPLGGRAACGVRVAGKGALAVGQGGLVLLNKDGTDWAYADLKLATEVRSCWDFHALHGVGEQIWVVGRPGSVVLHSPDCGQSWNLLKTGQPLPLNGVYFANGRRGWAVGELGSILSTADGGKSWRAQHRGGQRAALLFVHARPTAVPLDTMALAGGEGGYLATGLVVLAEDPVSAAPGRSTEPQRLVAAVRQVGGAAGERLWQFPMPQHLADADQKTLLQAWNRLHQDRAPEELLRQLVLALRIWRPSVVVTDHPDARVTGSAVDALVAEALHAAFSAAADPKAFPEQIEDLGLEAWPVAKAYCTWDKNSGSQVTLDLTQAGSRLEETPRDFAGPAAEILADSPATLPAQRHYHLLESRIAGAANHRTLMQGVELAPGGVARRKITQLGGLSPEAAQALRNRRNLLAIAENPRLAVTDPDKILAQIDPLLAGMPGDQGAKAASALANYYASIGQWGAARELFLLLVNRYPAHALSADAYRWLIRYHASSEARRRRELGQFYIQIESTIRAAEQWKVTERVGVILPEVVARRQVTLLGSQEQIRQWYQECLDFGTRLDAFGPLQATDPSVQFCLQATRRRLGEFDKAREWYAQFHREHADGPWHDAAGAELWLVNRIGPPPKPVAFCRHTATRPFLDGDFNDACWQEIKPLALQNAVGDTVKEYPTEVRLAYDSDFLYLALRCQHPADRYVAPVKTRPADADLRPYDRVSLLLDLDRDYSTYFHFQMDQRGCVRDDCWGDLSWNPRWFVALRSQPDAWQVEAAIPLTELTGEAVNPGKAWACNIVRVLPGRGVQAWSLPADVQPRPEGMGLLTFIQEPASNTASKPAGNPGNSQK
jgi:photosystem II stability/assembly factor-like uncharacterized protein/tetratricopeptide (TPR) repeat protein